MAESNSSGGLAASFKRRSDVKNPWLFRAALTLLCITVMTAILVFTSLRDQLVWLKADNQALRIANGVLLTKIETGDYPDNLSKDIVPTNRFDYRRNENSFVLVVYVYQDGYESVSIDSKGRISHDQ